MRRWRWRCPRQSSADLIISTLDNPPVGTDLGVTNTNAAMEFATGSQAETMGSVTLELLGNTGPVQVSLLANVPNFTPGATLVSIGTIDPSSSPVYNTYTLPTPAYTLAADTVYWLAVAYPYEANTLPGPWAYTNANPPGYNESGTGSSVYFAISADNGATWAVGANATYGPYMFSVSSVPEPSTLCLASIAASLGIGVSIRKHRKRKANGTAP